MTLTELKKEISKIISSISNLTEKKEEYVNKLYLLFHTYLQQTNKKLFLTCGRCNYKLIVDLSERNFDDYTQWKYCPICGESIVSFIK